MDANDNPLIGDSEQFKLNRELDRRIRALEGSMRTGLSRTRFVRATASASPTTFGSWESGVVANTWIDSEGNVGTGYPELTVETGSKALLILSVTVSEVGNAANRRTAVANFGIGINGANPLLSSTPAPVMYRQYSNTADLGPLEFPISFTVYRADFVPGVNVLKIWALFENTIPAALIQPRMGDATLSIIPID